MSEVITTAGAREPKAEPAPNPRREAIKLIRGTLRNQAATEDEVDDALEALVELAKD